MLLVWEVVLCVFLGVSVGWPNSIQRGVPRKGETEITIKKLWRLSVKVVGAAGKGGACWKETRDGLGQDWGGWGGLHCWRLGTLEAKLPTGWVWSSFLSLCLWLAHPLGGRSEGFDYGWEVRICDDELEFFKLAQNWNYIDEHKGWAQ